MQLSDGYCVQVVIHSGKSDSALRGDDGHAERAARRSRFQLIGSDKISMRRELDQVVLCASGKDRIPVGRDQIALWRQDQSQWPMKMLLIGEDDEPGTLVAAAVACVRDGENLIVIGRGDVQRVMIAVVR